jgi:hypothetical protein
MNSKETTMYKIYGDYGYRTECLLHETESLPAAERWVDGYTQSGDMGGYNIIEVARFDARDEYVVEYMVQADGFDYADEFYEGDDDFALIDEF